MLTIISDALRIASKTDTRQNIAERRYLERQEMRRRDEEFYRNRLKSFGTRW